MAEETSPIENHSRLSQSRGTYRCSGGDEPAKSEKKAPQHPGSDANKGADTPTPVKVPASSTPPVEMDRKTNELPSDGQIWPKEPPDTD